MTSEGPSQHKLFYHSMVTSLPAAPRCHRQQHWVTQKPKARGCALPIRHKNTMLSQTEALVTVE